MKVKLKLSQHITKDGTKQIQLFIFHKGQRLHLDTGVKIDPKYWEEQHQQVSGRIRNIDENPTTLNIRLQEKVKKLQTIVDNYFDEYLTYPTIEYLKEKYFEKATIRSSEQDVKVLFEAWIKNWQVQDKKIYKTVLNDLKELYPSKPLYFREIDNVFFSKLLKLWESKNIQNSTINKRNVCLKVFLRDQSTKIEDGKKINNYDYFKTFKTNLSTPSNQSIIIPTEKEFKQIIRKKLSNELLDRARDWFVIGCSTGLRYGDIKRLTPNQIKKVNGVMCIVTDNEKTGEPDNVIPLNKISEKFIKKQFTQNKNKGIKYLSNWKLNENLHLLFKELKFNTPETILKKYPNKKTERINLPKWEAMTQHDSRKFFISRCVNSGFISLGATMSWSSHKNLKVVQRYIHKGFDQAEQMKKLFDL